MSHPFHKIIGDLIEKNSSLLKPSFKVIFDPACNGATKKVKQNIPLFVSKEAQNKNEYCNVDILIHSGCEIKVIIEIEETNMRPTQICGKFLTSALSKNYIHKFEKNEIIPMGKNVLFVQVVKKSNLKTNTSKIKQWENLKGSIRSILPLNAIKEEGYRLFWGNEEDFKQGGEKGEELINCILNFLKIERKNT